MCLTAKKMVMESAARTGCISLWKQQSLIILLSYVCYINSIWGEFVFDDNEALLNNNDLDLNTTWMQVFQNDFWGTDVFSSSSHKSYRPFTVTSFRLNSWLAGGLKPMSFHLVNIFLHGVASLLYFHVCIMIWIQARQKNSLSLAPMVAALVFAVHPVHTESVAGVVGRAELMSAICFFLALLCYAKACEETSTLSNMCFWILVSIVLAVFALLFKEQGVTVMGICLVFDVFIKLQLDPLDFIHFKCSRKDTRWRRFFIRVGMILTSMGLIVILRLSTGAPTFNPVDNAASFAESILTRVLSYNYIYAINTWLLLNPWWLCFDWSMGCIPVLESLVDARLIAVLLFWMGFGSLLVYCIIGHTGPTKRLISVSLGMMVITFLPASNLLIRVGFVVAERILYLPSAGYCLLVGLGIARVMQSSRKLVWTGLAFLLTIFIVRSIYRSSQWLTEEELFISGIRVCPGNAKVLYNIGKVKSDGGDAEMGITAYREAIKLYPEYDQALNNLGNLLKGRGNHAEAEELFHKAIDATPTFAAAWMNLGIVQAALGKWKEAENSYKTAITHRKKYPDAYYNLGNLYVDRGKHESAAEAYEAAISLKKNHVSAWSNMGLLYENLKMYDKAEEVMKSGITEIPNAAQLFSSLGILLGKQNRLEEGKNFLETAVSLSPFSGNYHANLGVIYHLMKDYKRAEDSYSLALKLQPDLNLAKENFNKLLSSRSKSSTL